MKRQIVVISVVISLVLLSLTASAVANEANELSYKSGELIVRFDEREYAQKYPNSSEKAAARQRVLTSAGGGTVKNMLDRRVSGLSVVKLPAGVSIEKALASYKKTPGILYVEPNYKRKLLVIPNDTRFNNLWGMNNTGQTGGTVDADIDAPEAWDVNTGSSSVIVAVTDTGVDYTHPDLAANMWHNPGEIPGNGIDDDGDGFIDDVYGCDTGDNDGDPMDNSADAGHGTHVSGIIGAVGNNATGVAGVCWHVNIMAVKIVDANGDIWEDAIIRGIQYAIDKGAKVMNASWGGYGYSQAEYDVIAAARDTGILFVAAAGNEENNNDGPYSLYPASFNLDNIISVMATDDTDAMSFYSNYGPTSVDIGAPGGAGYGGASDILSTYPGGGYVYKAGTSMAAPHVTGACALLRAVNPSLSYTQIKDALLSSVDNTLPGLCVSGGRLNLSQAVAAAIEDHTPPVPNPAEWDIEPQATGLHTIAMEATTATDNSGVEYFFECVTDANFNSGWQSDTLYERNGFNANTTYTFRVKCRDKSDNHNETDWSAVKSATTANVSDNLPPFPSPSRWKTKPAVVKLQPPPRVRMIAMTSTDETSPVQYYFRCTYVNPAVPDPNVFNSGWQSSSIYTISSGLIMGSTYTFTVKARDAVLPTHNETAESDQASVTVSGQSANVLTVPVPYATIQDAIDAASNGDIVEVRPGTYGGNGNYDIRFKGKAITVMSIDPNDPCVVAGTIIDVNAVQTFISHRAFDFNNFEGSNSILAGFTITNGFIYSIAPSGAFLGSNGANGSNLGGGAIKCTGSSPTIRNCVITNSFVFGGFGGYGAPGDPNFPLHSGNGGNGGNGFGGGIYCDPLSNPTIYGCTVNSCVALGGYGGNGGPSNGPNVPAGGNGGRGGNGFGGGIYCDAGSNAIISSCDISNCLALPGAGGTGGAGTPSGSNGADGQFGSGGGVYYGPGYAASTIDTQITGNEADSNGGGIYCDTPNYLTLINCDISNNSCTNGNGGGILHGLGGTLTLNNCGISSNYCVSGSGGGIWYDHGGTLTLNNCTVKGNLVPDGEDGGGIYAGSLVSPRTTVIIGSGSTISNNAAEYGGGLFLIGTNLTVNDSTISNNDAFEGAGVWDYNCIADVNNCMVKGNSATTFGGGFSLIDSLATINNSYLTGNSANGSVGGSGGAIYFEGWSNNPHQVTNCLITDNTAYSDGGGLSNNIGAWVQITNCTFVGNEVTGSNSVGGGISCAEYWAYVEIFNSILWGNKATAGGSQIAVGAPDGSQPGNGRYADVDVSYSDVQGGEAGAWLEDETQTYTALWWLDGNKDKDPLFATTKVTEQTYFLSQIVSGQLIDSPCVDAGNGNASDLESIVGMPLTTRTDLVADSCTNNVVDMGYHYEAGLAPQYQLTVKVVNKSDPNDPNGPNGNIKAPSLDPNAYTYKTYTVKQGTVVELEAIPNPGCNVIGWTGTDTIDPNRETGPDPCDPNKNTVTMDSSKTITVEFDTTLPSLRIFILSGQGTTIPEPNITHIYPDYVVNIVATPSNPTYAVRWSGDVDNLYATTRTNTVTMTAVPKNKEVYVEFYEQRYLYVPAEYPTLQVAIDAAGNGDVIILDEADQPYYTELGYTIAGKAITITSAHPDDPCCVARTVIEQQTGPQPNHNFGPAFDFYDVEPDTILNGITIRGFYANAGRSIDGNPAQNGHYDGYPGGSLASFGIRCDYLASPTIKNCIIEDCHLTGGVGGNGAAGDAGHPNGGNGGWPGGAYGGGIAILYGSNPIIINCTFNNCTVLGGNGGDGGNGNTTPGGRGGRGGGWYYDYPMPSPWEFGPFEFYTYYSGFGGAVYVDADCSPIFTDCSFINNSSRGGLNGICGLDEPGDIIEEPSLRYRIDNFGGAVFCQTGSNAKFVGCTFTNNLADPNRPHFDPTVAGSYENNKSVTSFGGAAVVGWNGYGANVNFDNCTFGENFGCYGGAIYGTFSEPDVADCNFAGNSAYSGGAVHFAGGLNKIIRSIFSRNEATGAVAQGGAICNLGADALIEDCQINYNSTKGSGGGIYVSSHDADGVELSTGDTVLIKNCLITRNVAARDGGGISANWYSDPNIVNCTIADNKVSGSGFSSGGYGGGLYCSYGNYTHVINSIIWDNSAYKGAQLAIQTAYKYDPRLSTVDVSYSSIGPDQNLADPNLLLPPASSLQITAAINDANIFDANILVNKILGPGIDVCNVSYTGAPNAAGTFVGGLAAGIGIESGIILTTGSAASAAIIPNVNDAMSTSYGMRGDANLSSIVGSDTNDAAVLEFDFVSTGGNVFFNYVFASEEYNEFVYQFNDVFAFFLDGKNIAFIPGTTTPVSVDSVNGGNPLGTNANNPAFYNNNDPTDGGPFFNVQYDGFTTVFTSEALHLTPGKHHIKLAIADTLDTLLDSAVFIQAGTFSDRPLFGRAFYIDPNCILKWDIDPNDPNYPTNLDVNDDPLFVAGYYLSHKATGQLVDSNAIDAGSDLASRLGLDTYTTRVDGVPDRAFPEFAVDGFGGSATGGAGGPIVTVSTAADFKTYVESTSTYIVQVSGTIDLGSVGGGVNIQSNKTIKGDPGAKIIGRLGFNNGASNVIIERLTITNPSYAEADGISVKNTVTNLLITHCTVYDCGDGCIDITNASDYVTVSWCKFYYTSDMGHNFVNLIGSSDDATGDRGKLHVTMHHNWYSNMCKERMPRVRFGQVHVYNNYYNNLLSGNYCHGVGVESQIRVEDNYYDVVLYPWKNYSGTPPSGKIGWNTGNVFYGCSVPTWATNDYATIFTPSYSYTLDAGTNVKNIVMAGAGTSGGDATPPAAPTGLTATAGNETVSLNWNNNSEGDLAGYYVYRSTSPGGVYSRLNSSLRASSDYIDNTVTNSTTYYYVVTAVDTSSNESGYSSEASATPNNTAPPAPSTGPAADDRVDIGYHYSQGVPPYKLTIRVVDGNGAVALLGEPNVYDVNVVFDVNQDATVRLQALPNPNYTVKKWTGTDDDRIHDSNNTVTMYSDRTVTVEFVKAICQLIIEAGPNGTLKAEAPGVMMVARPSEPNASDVNSHTVVGLQAVPYEGYRVARWIGSDNNDSSTSNTNIVTIDSDKMVRVEFEQPQTITVPGDHIDIQSAIGAARPGDVVKVASGVYNGSQIIVNKPITVTSTNPDDPCVVANTIIDSSGYASRAVVFYTGATQDTVFDGFTIRGGTYNTIDARDANGAGRNGEDGYSIGGGAVYIYDGTSPTIKNCVITDTNIAGGNAGNGGNADATVDAGRGGWASGSYGGGIYIDSNANPTLVNCTITNCVVRGGNAGNGGNSSGTYGDASYHDANHGGSWSNDETFPWQSLVGSNGQPYLGDYWYYGGLGGGVFCAPNSSATFRACNITNNTAFGGMSGIGGTRPFVIPDPVVAYRIPSFGGGVFCANDTNVMFIDCNITGNTAPRPDGTYHLDPYLGHGGGVAFVQTAHIEFINCNITDNNAAVGGGMYWMGGDPQVLDCNIAGNTAYVGGGTYGTNSTGLIQGCTIHNNFAGVSPNDADTNAIGQGGGIYSASMESQITDCTIIGNEATASGGGILFAGVEANMPIVKNCLVVDNRAGRDGGGLSINWYATPLITNCTIVGNEATGNFGVPGRTGFGGGIYSSYHSHPVILNSILWNNYALHGIELAVGTGFEYDLRPSTVDINYSDIKGAQVNVFVDAGCTLNWGSHNLYADPCFVTGPLGNYYLSQTDTNDPNQTVNSPCVDTGNDLASNVGLYLLYTTRTDEVFDTSIVDMGYHYPLAHPIDLCSFSDLSHDGIVNLDDLAIFGLYWLNENCSDSNGWCGGADLTFDTYVNSSDLASFYECWLAEDTEPPLPNPSEWEIAPYSSDNNSISMTAKAAYDNWGGVVEYYFECVTCSNDSNSGWNPNRTYDPNNLEPNTVYGYRVKARDERGNETLWSTIDYAIIGEGQGPPPVEDHNPPTPDSMTWATPPYAISSTAITMVATTATDDTAGVQYYFEDFNHPDVNSGWQNSTTWTDTMCDPNTTYTFRVKARDTSFWLNETGWSDLRSATTPAEVIVPPPDTTPPLPSTSAFAAGGSPRQYGPDANGYYRHTMTAVVTDDATTGGSNPCEYYFEFVVGGTGPQSSGWQLSNVYDYEVALNSAQYGVYRVKARDAAGIETDWSDEWSTNGPLN